MLTVGLLLITGLSAYSATRPLSNKGSMPTGSTTIPDSAKSASTTNNSTAPCTAKAQDTTGLTTASSVKDVLLSVNTKIPLEFCGLKSSKNELQTDAYYFDKPTDLSYFVQYVGDLGGVSFYNPDNPAVGSKEAQQAETNVLSAAKKAQKYLEAASFKNVSSTKTTFYYQRNNELCLINYEPTGTLETACSSTLRHQQAVDAVKPLAQLLLAEKFDLVTITDPTIKDSETAGYRIAHSSIGIKAASDSNGTVAFFYEKSGSWHYAYSAQGIQECSIFENNKDRNIVLAFKGEVCTRNNKESTVQ